MNRWEGKVALVTGASSGIGAAVVEQLVEAGLKVVGLGRRFEKIEKISKLLAGKKGTLYAFKADIGKENELLDAFEWTNKNLGPIHILINNAATGNNSTLLESESEVYRNIMEVNVVALTIACREAVKIMRENNIEGHIVNINSILGHKQANFMDFNIYPASKYAVSSICSTLRQELIALGSKIKITSVSPGIVATDFWNANGYLNNKTKVMEFQKIPQLDPKDIAHTVMFVLATPPEVEVQEVLVRPLGEVL